MVNNERERTNRRLEGTSTFTEVPTVFGNFTSIMAKAEIDRLQANSRPHENPQLDNAKEQKPKVDKDAQDPYPWGVYSAVKRFLDGKLK